MVKVERRHLDMWARASELTKPSASRAPRPTYGAHHRQPRKREAEPEAESEGEEPELDAIGAE